MVLMFKVRARSTAVTVALASVAWVLVGCSGLNSSATPERQPGTRIRVVAAVYPLAFAAKAIGAADVEVSTLATGGVEPHEQELTAKQVALVERADVVIYVPGLSAAVDAAVGQSSALVVDALAALGQHRRTGDPHLWLNPIRLADVGKALATTLSTFDAPHQATYAASAVAFRSTMTQLDADIKNQTRPCATQLMVTTHTAFGYFAGRYNFRQVSILGADPEAEPTPAALARIVKLIRENHITSIYGEVGHTSKALNAVAAETGAKVRLLYTLESPLKGTDYITAMRSNAATISAGQGCQTS